MKLKKLYLLILLTPFVFSQDNSTDSDVEEVVVVGSQVKGAKITGALPVSVISSEDMEALGIDSIKMSLAVATMHQEAMLVLLI